MSTKGDTNEQYFEVIRELYSNFSHDFDGLQHCAFFNSYNRSILETG
jgi:hypothetical protein